MSCYLQGGASLVLVQTADALHTVWHRRTAVMGLLYQALQELTQNRYSNGGSSTILTILEHFVAISESDFYCLI